MWYGLHSPQPDLFTPRRVLNASSYVRLYFPHHCGTRAKSFRTAQSSQGSRGHKVDTPNQGCLASIYLYRPELMQGHGDVITTAGIKSQIRGLPAIRCGSCVKSIQAYSGQAHGSTRTAVKQLPG